MSPLPSMMVSAMSSTSSAGMPLSYLWLIPLLPFAGFLINGTLGRRLPRAAVTAVALFFTAIPAAIVAWLWRSMTAPDAPEVLRVVSRPWILITGLRVDFAFTVDHLTLIMLGVVTGVGFLIHLYSAGYMANEEGYWRFFAYLNLFMFFMSVLVLADSFLLLFVGWEGVGLASYLLIGFYFEKDSAANAGKKAFLFNRIGDVGFLLAMFFVVQNFGSLDFTRVFAAITANPGWHGGILTAIALLLVLGAIGKSAQIPLYVWLPDAMEGPTPVSALIHAATMVTAGIYMVARCHTLFDRSPYALGVVALIGAATAIFTAIIGLVQHDIKRVLAYSTVSQLGYMFLACGVGAYTAGIFHLLTHAFFKALLFLAAGSVIHALSGEQDMRNMGGLRRRIPITFWTMTAGVFAIAGIYPFAGFFSKDEILFRTFTFEANPALGKFLWIVALVTAGLTAFYMFRLWFKTFFGPERFDQQGQTVQALSVDGASIDAPSTLAMNEDRKAAHENTQAAHAAHLRGVHESPWVMLLPLIILALLSVVGGWVGIPAALGGHNEIERFLAPVFTTGGVISTGELASTTNPNIHTLELTLAAVSLVTAALGFYLAFLFYYKKPGTAAALAQLAPALYRLVDNKFYIDHLYFVAIVTPVLMFTRIVLAGLIDGGLVNGSGSLAGAVTRGLGSVTNRTQSGNIRSYAGWIALGAAAVLLVMIFGRTLWMHE